MRFRRFVYCCTGLAASLSGCIAPRALRPIEQPELIAESAVPELVAVSESKIRRLPSPQLPVHQEPVQNGLRLISHEAPDTEPETLPVPDPLAAASAAAQTFPLDLPTALRLADADNLQVALAREQIEQAYAESLQANSLWLPSLRAGVHWNRHKGPLLDTAGVIQDISRGSLYAGGGAMAIGAGSPAIPGLFANFNLADALFQPLAAQQRAAARESGATVTRNNVLLDVSLAYLELLRAAQDVEITEDLYKSVEELTRLTVAFARTGQGLQADADRMQVELGLREIDIRRSKESYRVASARLAQLLRLEPCVQLQPADSAVVRLCITPDDCECVDLVALALTNRPELAQSRFLVMEAIQRMKRDRYAPLVPSFFLGASYGGFGGGPGGAINDFSDRFDLDAAAFWELRNLGMGEAAARDGADSRLRQARIQELSSLDLVAREVTEAHAQLQLRRQQIETAQKVVKFATESYDHNLARIKNGQGLPIEALQSTQALLQARREYLRAIIDHNSAQFTLQRALGWPVGGPELSE